MKLPELRAELRAVASPERAEVTRSFFKTGPGEYSEKDKFLGIRIPDLRSLAKKADAMSLKQVVTLLRSEWHEERFMALLLMERRFARAGEESIRDNRLNQHSFSSLEEARLLINHWRHEDNSLRLHGSVGRIPPTPFALTFTPNPTHDQHLNSASA